ncbi:signal peptidase I [Georhizobium profundi]|jgi:signal peptidase I|uniref:Signal peptidase I n=1 Tax=Georhizobium profundi TaxID=2341112 RepID=A0A3S9B6D3_9HYPH|nr:signal peptidase I [Georhizobium profundi]AZN72499.1 signal peptidase I [Georhizobium profundi]GLQ38874.1 signal peptidase I [Rhizobium albus]
MSVSDTGKKQKSGALGENIKVILQALALALVIRTLLFQPFSIPSGSMMPTLLVGDYLFVSKYAYGYSKYSLPLSPDLFEGRIWGAEPERGDVAVFRYPPNPDLDYIKRVIGLPGDTVQMRNGVLFINDEAVEREQVGTYRPEGRYDRGEEVPLYRETLPNGVSYNTLDLTPNSPGDNTREFLVPPGHYFMMGDNRDNSADSRFEVGFVPFENFVGRANIIFFSMDAGTSPLELWNWPSDLRFDRLFQSAQQ